MLLVPPLTTLQQVLKLLHLLLQPVDNAAQAAVSAPVATTPMTREEVKKQNEAKLPQTGNENGIVAMALGTMLAMFGLGVAAKKRY